MWLTEAHRGTAPVRNKNQDPGFLAPSPQSVAQVAWAGVGLENHMRGQHPPCAPHFAGQVVAPSCPRDCLRVVICCVFLWLPGGCSQCRGLMCKQSSSALPRLPPPRHPPHCHVGYGCCCRRRSLPWATGASLLLPSAGLYIPHPRVWDRAPSFPCGTPLALGPVPRTVGGQ